ncbi:hypothetical protein [Deinococcus marmoris]|uniref:hypothetical protein n=1 Tax=Deinococcus marmoris TaxID=249408 RepID=UPI0004953E18|nr:hypothetical protein [Deinococcus marmoris]
MSTLKTAVRPTSSALVLLVLLAFPGTLAIRQTPGPPDTLATQVSAMSATGLKLAECEQRMQTLGTMLSRAGYVSRRAHVGADTVMTSLWYHPQHHTSVVAFSGLRASDNAFSAAEMAGEVRWNELLATP